MVVFRDLKGLMEVIIIWEDKLTDYYDTAEKISAAISGKGKVILTAAASADVINKLKQIFADILKVSTIDPDRHILELGIKSIQQVQPLVSGR